MDLATLIGVLAGFALIGSSIVMGGGASAFVNIPAIVITIGGTFAACLINYPLNVMFQMFSVVKSTIFYSVPEEEYIINKLLELAYTYRKDGPLGLEKKAELLRHPFFKRSCELLLEGIKEDVLEKILLREIYSIRERHRIGQDVLTSMGNYAPAFGMIGTLIGLIQMLRTLNDPSTIGYGMSVALLTTFYGALVANLLFMPLAGKLKERSAQELFFCDLIAEGMVAISTGDTPRLIKEKILAFSDNRIRKKIKKK